MFLRITLLFVIVLEPLRSMDVEEIHPCGSLQRVGLFFSAIAHGAAAVGCVHAASEMSCTGTTAALFVSGVANVLTTLGYLEAASFGEKFSQCIVKPLIAVATVYAWSAIAVNGLNPALTTIATLSSLGSIFGAAFLPEKPNKLP